MNIIKKLCNTSINFQNGNVVWILLDLFYHDFHLKWYVFLFVLTPRCWVLACHVILSGYWSYNCTCKFLPLSGRNPNYGVDFPREENPYNRVRFSYASEWGEIPSTKPRSWASGRKKSLQHSLVSEWGEFHRGVALEGCRGALVAIFE